MQRKSNKPTVGDITQQVHNALKEDLGGWVKLENDISASLIAHDAQAMATIITRDNMVLCGKDWAHSAFSQLDPAVRCEWNAQDGQYLSKGSVLCEVKGNARALLCAERTALNFLQTLSATATTTFQYASILKGSKTKLLDTRKTLPSLRNAQKYAVSCGGGMNHRIGLFDAFLIKENHIAACNGIKNAIFNAKAAHPNKRIEVEIENFDELNEALAAGADVIMLDNFSTEQVKRAVAIVAGQCQLEVSGNITSARLAELAQTGVDFISSGALTKNVQAIDLSMRLGLLTQD